MVILVNLGEGQRWWVRCWWIGGNDLSRHILHTESVVLLVVGVMIMVVMGLIGLVWFWMMGYVFFAKYRRVGCRVGGVVASSAMRHVGRIEMMAVMMSGHVSAVLVLVTVALFVAQLGA